MAVFSGLFGNESTKERIARNLKNETLPHAFLIKGPAGSGKHTLALEIAAAVNCENRDGTGDFPCHVCRTCRRIFARQFTDLKFLQKPQDKSSVGVAEVRAFREDMFLSPSESDAKIYVLENAELLTTQAQNALLKILEEPPGRMYVFLLTESEEKILTTVKSRAQRIATELFEPDVLSRYLLQRSEEARSLNLRSGEEYRAVLLRAGGTVGQALSLLDSNAVSAENKMRSAVLSILSASLPGKPYEELRKAFSSLPTKRGEFAVFIDRVLLAIRDMIALKNGTEDGTFLFFLNEEEAKSVTEKWKLSRLFRLFDIYRNAAEQNAKNGNLSLIGANVILETRKL